MFPEDHFIPYAGTISLYADTIAPPILLHRASRPIPFLLPHVERLRFGLGCLPRVFTVLGHADASPPPARCSTGGGLGNLAGHRAAHDGLGYCCSSFVRATFGCVFAPPPPLLGGKAIALVYGVTRAPYGRLFLRAFLFSGASSGGSATSPVIHEEFQGGFEGFEFLRQLFSYSQQ